MATSRRILIADPDLEAARALSRALRQQGHQVHYAADGSKALEVSVLRHPDLALFDETCPLIDARSFVQILRTNPRTETIPVLLTTRAYDADKMRAFRDGYLEKPFNLDEVLSRIDHLFRRSDAAQQLKGESKELIGNLGQLTIPDLLQILAMNKRSGRLRLEHGSERGEIHVVNGRAVNAKVSAVEGEKALFRVLAWVDGSFEFLQGGTSPRALIDRGMDDVLLEGMRHADEVGRLLPRLPAPPFRLSLAPGVEPSVDLHPVTAQVVALLRQPRLVSEVLDLCPAHDLDVLGALTTLVDKGLAVPVESLAAGEGRAPLLGPAEVHALRARLLRGRPAQRVSVAHVVACAQGPKAWRRIAADLAAISGHTTDLTALRSGFGTLGSLALSDVLSVELCVLPAGDAARPLWRPFSSGALGALLIDDSAAALSLARYLAFEVRVPLVVVGGSVPPSLQSAPAGAVGVNGGLGDALGVVLRQSPSRT